MSSAVVSLVSPAKTENAPDLELRRDPSQALPWLPCTVSVELPAVRFTIGDLLKLRPGTLIETTCHHTSYVPLSVNEQLVGWTEFEVMADKLAVRITEMA